MEINLYFIRDHVATLTIAGLSTLAICAAALVIGAAMGALLCCMRMSRIGALNKVSSIVIDSLRSIPELVLIFWLYSCLPLVTYFSLTSLQTGILSLSLIAAAYLAEIFRAGINGVHVGQPEAGFALGLTRFQTLRLIIAPQAARMMISPFLNFLCDLIKISTLLSALSLPELAYKASVLASNTYRYLEIYTIVGAFYFLVIFTLSTIARSYERRLLEIKT